MQTTHQAITATDRRDALQRPRSGGAWPMRRRVANKGVPGERCNGPVTDSDLAAGPFCIFDAEAHQKQIYTS